MAVADKVTGLKRCIECHENLLPTTENFCKDKSRTDGLTSKCRDCIKQYNTDNKERKAKHNSDYNKANTSKVSKYNTQYNNANRERLKEVHKKYRQSPEGLEHKIAAVQTRRVRKEGLTTEVESVLRSEVIARDGYKCQICGKKVDKDLRWPDSMSLSLDHIVPISKGGPHTLSNLRVTHLACNLKKGSKVI